MRFSDVQDEIIGTDTPGSHLPLESGWGLQQSYKHTLDWKALSPVGKVDISEQNGNL